MTAEYDKKFILLTLQETGNYIRIRKTAVVAFWTTTNEDEKVTKVMIENNLTYTCLDKLEKLTKELE